jgi:DNA-binding transcriptional regulator YiaG
MKVTEKKIVKQSKPSTVNSSVKKDAKPVVIRSPKGNPKERYGNVKRYPSPPPEAIKRLRLSANLLQHTAAEMLRSTLSTYNKWESGTNPMHPGLWELFKILVKDEIDRNKIVESIKTPSLKRWPTK